MKISNILLATVTAALASTSVASVNNGLVASIPEQPLPMNLRGLKKTDKKTEVVDAAPDAEAEAPAEEPAEDGGAPAEEAGDAGELSNIMPQLESALVLNWEYNWLFLIPTCVHLQFRYQRRRRQRRWR